MSVKQQAIITSNKTGREHVVMTLRGWREAMIKLNDLAPAPDSPAALQVPVLAIHLPWEPI